MENKQHPETSFRLTTENDWLAGYEHQQFDDQSNHDIAALLKKYLPHGKGKQALEIGSYPGAFLPTIGRLGYKVNGIDFHPGNTTELPMWLAGKGCEVGSFVSEDFFTYTSNSKERFDLVCSFGFIEHFRNFDAVIRLHAELVAPGGSLVITVPNFRGWMQYLPHRILDKENLAKHYLPSMSPAKWKKELEALGFTVQFSGYFGGYSFWYGKEQHRNFLQKKLLWITERVIARVKKLLRFFHLESAAWSAYGGIVAVRS